MADFLRNGTNAVSYTHLFIFLREEITWLTFVSMILIGIGTYLMIQKKETKEKAEDKKWLFYAVGSAVFASLTSILGKMCIRDRKYTLCAADIFSTFMMAGGIVLFWYLNRKI